MSSSPYSIALELAAVLALWVGLSVWQRDRRSPAGLWFVGLAGAVLVWCLGELLSWWGLLDAYQRDRVAFLGVLAVPPLWVGVAAHASGLELARRVPWFPVTLLVPSAVLYGLLHMGPWSNVFLVSDGAIETEGPLFAVWTGYAYALIVLGVLLFGVAAVRWQGRDAARRIAGLTLGVAIPMVGNAIYLFGLLGWENDPTPVLMGLAAVPMRGALFKSHFFDVLPADQREILRQLPVGLVTTDATGAVLDLNPAAEGMLRSGRARLIGRDLDAVLAHRGPDVHVRVVALPGTGGAQVAVLDTAVSIDEMEAGGEGPEEVAA